VVKAITRTASAVKNMVSKQLPLAPNSRDSLITRSNLARRVTFSQKWLLANVSESGESKQRRLANVLG
jgi:hypothetical protein